jgi:peptide-methionine (R)-S-oxide reductase
MWDLPHLPVAFRQGLSTMRHATLLLLILPGIAGCGEAVSTDPRSSQATVTAAKTPRSEDSGMPDKIVRTEEQWKQLLTPEQYRVLRGKGTEQPFVNEYDDHFSPGTYACAACGQELFSSETKFNSGCGWPAFYAAKAEDRVTLTPDLSGGRVRTEVTCSRCGSHLGHIFDDAPQTPTGQRYCINSVAMKFIPAPGQQRANAEK